MSNFNNVQISSTHRIPPAWTTARCNRLLRPLVSSLGKLWAVKKRRDAEAQWNQKETSARSELHSNLEDSRFTELDYASSEEELEGHHDDDDPVWLPTSTNHGAPRIRHKYSRQRRIRESDDSQENKNASCVPNKRRCRPGDIILSTPMLRKTLTSSQNTPETPKSSVMSISAKSATKKSRNKARDSHEERLQVAFAYLLEATKPPLEQNTLEHSNEASQRGTGCKSLLSMCLRKVPDIIRHEQELQKQLDEVHESDVSTEIYDILEDLEVVLGAGWPHLRHLVRFHAVQMISDAIRENVLDLHTSKTLSWLCVRQQEFSAANDLLSVLGPRLAGLPNAHNNVTSHMNTSGVSGLSFLRTACVSLSRSIWYHQLTQLLEYKCVTVDQLASSEFQPMWNEVVSSIGRQSRHAFTAMKTLETFFLKCCEFSNTSDSGSGLPGRVELNLESTTDIHAAHGAEWNSALQNTIFSLCTILCVLSKASMLVANMVNRSMRCIQIAIAQNLQAPDARFRPRRYRQYREAIMTMASSQVILATMEVQSEYRHLIDASSQPLQTMLSLSAGGKLAESHTAILVSLACSIAQSSDRLYPKSGLELIRSLSSHLMSISTHDQASTNLKWVAKKLALDVTFAYSQNSQSSGSQSLLRTVEKSVGMLGSERSKTHNDLHPNTGGYRWEEGICEWVTTTPARDRPAITRLRRSIAPPKDPPGKRAQTSTSKYSHLATNKNQRASDLPRFHPGDEQVNEPVMTPRASHRSNDNDQVSIGSSESSEDELCLSARALSRKRSFQKRVLQDISNLPHPTQSYTKPFPEHPYWQGSQTSLVRHRRVEAESWDDELSFEY